MLFGVLGAGQSPAIFLRWERSTHLKNIAFPRGYKNFSAFLLFYLIFTAIRLIGTTACS
jgi:hypothetical protein